jgi:hypothetical protein
MIPQGWGNLGFTSGRRTYLGNRTVGGVPNSDHLTGRAADFTAPASVLRSRFGPNVKILDEGDHRHVSGLSDVPYYGNQGIKGLVNGVDTSAPQGKAMLQPKKPPVNPMPGSENPLLAMDNAPVSSMPLDGGQADMAGLSQMADPGKLKKGGVFGSGLSFGDILANGLVGFAAGMGNSAPLDAMTRAQIQEEDRNLARERLAAQVAMSQAKLREPPQFVQDAAAFARLPREQQRQIIEFRNAMYPVTADVQDESGATVRQIVPRQLPQTAPQAGAEEDGYVFLGGDPANPDNWRQK